MMAVQGMNLVYNMIKYIASSLTKMLDYFPHSINIIHICILLPWVYNVLKVITRTVLEFNSTEEKMFLPDKEFYLHAPLVTFREVATTIKVTVVKWFLNRRAYAHISIKNRLTSILLWLLHQNGSTIFQAKNTKPLYMWHNKYREAVSLISSYSSFVNPHALSRIAQ